MPSRNITIATSLVVVVILFLLLVILNEVLRKDDPVNNHKVGSLLSFGRDNNSSSRTVIPAPFKPSYQKELVCPYLKTGLRTDWAVEKASYNAKDEIFLDWNIDSFLFTYMHYKALESAFVSYPKASFSLIIVGPNAANYYKINDLISKHQFQKYKKRGYHITPVVVDSMKAVRGRASSLTLHYWSQQESQYCTTKGKKQVHDVKMAPFHVWMYVRLQKLLSSSGGISFDFSWLHLKPLGADINFGFKMCTVCSSLRHSARGGSASKEEVQLTPSSSLLNPYEASFNNVENSYKDCYTSSFIVLRKRYMTDKIYENILMCMLTKYDDQVVDGSGSLLNCFEKDILTGGALCLQIALTDCFAQYAENQLASEPRSRMQSTEPTMESSKGVYSSLLTFKWQSEVASKWQLQPVYSPAGSTLNCFVQSVLYFFKTISSTYPDVMSTCPTAHDLDTELGKEDSLSNLKNMDALQISAIWLGRNLGHRYKVVLSNQSQTQTDENNFPFTKWESEKSALDWFVPEGNTVLGRVVNVIESHMCRPIGDHPAADMHRGTCELLTSSVLTSTMSTAVQSPIPVSRPLENSRMGKSCSINFVIPGFMKCASSFLFEALTNHPQVLRALKGVNFKETGCYLPPTKGVLRVDSPNHRMNCFPFVEKHESNFIYGDATVTYSSDFNVPFYLQKDNAHIKSIFVIRNPISRLESHFRFSLSLMKSLGFDLVDKAVVYALRSDSSLHSLRKDAESLLLDLNEDKSSKDIFHGVILLTDCMSNLWVLYFRFDHCAHLLQESGNNNIDMLHEKNKISQYVSKFFTPSNSKERQDRVACTIVRTSIYFPVIAHWSKVLHPENVLVVENEYLSLKSKQSRSTVALELKKIHRFLNISEHDKSVPGQMVHNTGKGVNVSTSSSSTRTALRDFFNPFNELLQRLLIHTKIATYDINYNSH